MSDQPKLEIVPPLPAPTPKPAWQSRTLWLAAVGLLAKYIPGPLGDLVRANESILTDIILAAVAGVRLGTDRGISWSLSTKF
jgi:hypothetical protein